jgi:hypothetical protein
MGRLILRRVIGSANSSLLVICSPLFLHTLLTIHHSKHDDVWTYTLCKYINYFPPTEVGPIRLFRDYVNKHDGFDDVKVITTE